MTTRVRALLFLLAAGLLLRLYGLPAWGTFDVEVQKAWSARAASAGVEGIYGPADADLARMARERRLGPLRALVQMPVPRARFTWGTGSYFVDYPPGSVIVLWAAGRLYGFFEPGLPNRRGFNAAVNFIPLLASLAIAWLLRRSATGPLGDSRALAFWLNPAVLLAAPYLGYQDTIFAALALAAVLALMDGRHAWSTALVVAAGLVKPQGALLVPTLLAVTLRETRPAAWLRAALAGLLAAVLILAPWWASGYLWSALDGCRRPLTQTTLAPLGLNAWWLAGWLMDATRTGLGTLARVVEIREFEAWSGFDPRLLSRALLGAATAANLSLLLRAPRDDRRMLPLSVILQVHAYALLGTSVHENHSFLAVALAPLLLGRWPRARATHALTSVFLFLSLFLAAGFGRRVTRLAWVAALRGSTGIDASVIVAALHVALVAALFVWVARMRVYTAPPRTAAAGRPRASALLRRFGTERPPRPAAEEEDPE